MPKYCRNEPSGWLARTNSPLLYACRICRRIGISSVLPPMSVSSLLATTLLSPVTTIVPLVSGLYPESISVMDSRNESRYSTGVR